MELVQEGLAIKLGSPSGNSERKQQGNPERKSPAEGGGFRDTYYNLQEFYQQTQRAVGAMAGLNLFMKPLQSESLLAVFCRKLHFN